jgi:hypothetical protein
MSLTSDRAAIATALDAVTDVSGYDDWPPMLAVGDAWARWGGYEASGLPLIFATTWKVYVVGGGTPGDAMQWMDDHLASILDAIDAIVFISTVAPVEFQIQNSGVLYGVEITAEKES